MKTKHSIDLGLSVLCAMATRDQTLSFRDMAEVCDCTPETLRSSYNSGIKKLKGIRGDKLRTFLASNLT